jgi:hypothetical protein
MEQSTILLKNDNKILPLKDTDLKNILVLGNSAAWPLTHGFGSGQVFVDRFIPPLWTLCDKYGIERIDLYSQYKYACNKDKSACITYIGYPNTRDDCPPEEGQNNYTNGTYVSEHRNEYQILEVLGKTLGAHENPVFDHTFIFGTQDTGEGVDRGALDWN